MITVDRRPESCEHVDHRYTHAETQERADAYLFMALASPVRLLAASDVPISTIELIAHFKIQQPTMSHHLHMLRDAGLVTCARDGLYVPYSMVAARIAHACSILHALTPE